MVKTNQHAQYLDVGETSFRSKAIVRTHRQIGPIDLPGLPKVVGIVRHSLQKDRAYLSLHAVEDNCSRSSDFVHASVFVGYTVRHKLIHFQTDRSFIETRCTC